MGYSDIGCTGSEIETPNLDALAENGVLFTNCYNTSRCCPTRASLLTGLYQHQAGYGYMDSDLGYPAYQGRFRNNVVTIAQVLQKNNYRTIMLGKWHLGHEKEYDPLARGFDRMYGIPKGGGVYFYPCVGRDRQVYLNKELVTPDSTWYSTDAFTDYAIEFSREAITDNKPFFMYLAYIAPHFPLQAWPGDINKYRGKYSKGYEFYRQQRFEKQKKLGITEATTKLSPPDYDEWDSLEDKEKEDLKMAIYAAQIDRMDQNIGRLVSVLKEQGELDNTIILFFSDNGGTDANLNAFPEAELGSRDSWTAYGKNWGNVSNTPYRKYKTFTHEGGIITPLIVHWPKGIKSVGRLSHEPVHITDIFPTILSLTQTQYPKRLKGKELMPLVGADIMPLVHGEKQKPNKTMFFEHQGNQAARIGNWKLVKTHNLNWELYNLKEDPTELNNLINKQKVIADSLKNQFNHWAEQCGLKPWPVNKN
ncbi:arylsulfatase [Maribellus maritimus]|uniref:arylsulfatase n=1 Tax=Maribellus maritimus TaxID=2870838 RepID=UPI001EECCB1B|nr:arylsulfatase [Maribellus maritimus]MCG6190491.1 arylsulfatase [Maribellus maritimus]